MTNVFYDRKNAVESTHTFKINSGGINDLPGGTAEVRFEGGRLANAALQMHGERSTNDKVGFWIVQEAFAKLVLELVEEHNPTVVEWRPSADEFNEQQAKLKACDAERLSAKELLKAEIERANKLQAFKDWVHGALDRLGVPRDGEPGSKHLAEGCRIGARFEWIDKRRNTLPAEREVERKRVLACVEATLVNFNCDMGFVTRAMASVRAEL